MKKIVSYKQNDSFEKKEKVVYQLMKSNSLYDFIVFVENNVTDIELRNKLIQLAVDFLGRK